MDSNTLETRLKLIKYCRYYKGEENVPLDKDFDTFLRFWYLERDYYFNTNEYLTNHTYWETYGIRFFDSFPKLKEYTKTIDNKRVLGFIAYATTMSYSHNPASGVMWITNYKYDD